MRNRFTYKKIVLLTLVATLAAVSCRKAEVMTIPGEEYITFSSPGISMDVETRARANDFLDGIPDGTSFGVLGYCLAYNPGTTEYNLNSGTSQWSLKRNLCPASIFYKQEIKVDAGVCSYSPLRRWYTDGTDNEGLAGQTLSDTDDFRYTFYAYYPYEDSGFNITPADAVTAGAPVITYSMPFSGTEPETVRDNSAVPDAMLGVQQNIQRASRKVQFNFSHIMTGLGFQINNFSQVGDTVTSPEDRGVDLIIYSIKLKGTFHKSVKVDMTEAAASVTYQDTYSGTFTIFESDEGRTIPWQQDGSMGSITMEPETFLRLLPGNEDFGFFGPASADPENDPNPVLVVDYKLGENDRTTEEIRRLGNFAPRSGVRYTAQINWVNNAFVLIMQADNGEIWEDGEAADGDTGNDDIIFM